MTSQESLYISIGRNMQGSEQSQMFGKPCFKINGKAFICFFQNDMVFKLDGEVHQEALNLKDAKLFDPSEKNRPMKAWVQVNFNHKDRWKELAKHAMKFVQNLS